MPALPPHSSPLSYRHSQGGEGGPPLPSPPPPQQEHMDPHGRRQYNVLMWQEAVVRCMALVEE